jgi:hypothetical protein
LAKFEKSVTLNLGNYNSMKIGITEASSFEECDKQINDYIKKLGLRVSEPIGNALKISY